MILFKQKKTFLVRHSWTVILSLAIISFLSYLYFDLPIAKWAETAPPFLIDYGAIVSELINPFPLAYLIVILFFIVRILYKKEALGNRILLIVVTVCSMNALILPIKILLGRARPELWFSKHLYGFEFFAMRISERSFPSGHAITIASILFSIACFYPRFFFSLPFVKSTAFLCKSA